MTAQTAPWCLVVPVKRLTTAKTRLTRVAGARREELALAFCLDTVAAALAASLVHDVIVVTDDEGAAAGLRRIGATVAADEPDSGLNPALLHGAQVAGDRHPGSSLGALSADLPALRPDELDDALRLASGHPLSMVRDAGGDGTTMLLARAGSPFVPRFGPGSAELHRADGAVDLSGPGVPSLRRDVDTEADLLAALALGLGPRSAEVVRQLRR
ncbi:MAG: 2-phospho-L-lactate/phosphoenolpyruvate guanylyltransferase [Actinomycetota bacterium]|nr:2-phospho-L-lactate/phosphoenolpyruvate guanylyltransferase [Actinomycetota bacterium]